MHLCEPAAWSTVSRLRLIDGSVEGPLSAGRGDSWAVSVAVCIPARNEAGTLGAIATSVARLVEAGVVDDLLVIDDGSSDATASVAAAAGARVVSSPGGPGKGQALRQAVAVTTADVLVFLDADVVNFTPRYVTALAARAACRSRPETGQRRPMAGRSTAAPGRRTCHRAGRPAIARAFLPGLGTIRQPLAGECALTRDLAQRLRFDDGYGIEIGMLIDTYLAYGRRAIVEVDVGGERVHRNRPLRESGSTPGTCWPRSWPEPVLPSPNWPSCTPSHEWDRPPTSAGSKAKSS